MNELNHFESLIISALFSVNESYYKTSYKNIETFKNFLIGRNGEIINDTFERFGERVFCYEFYHQLRILIDEERKRNVSFLEGAILQGEVEKMHIIKLIESLGLEMMDKEYSPDFLMHSPGNADSHPCVIEVKCEKTVSKAKVLVDLKKLNQFVTKFKYEKGIFLAINSQIDYIECILTNLSDEISMLEGREKIKIICKTNQVSPVKFWQL